MTIAHAHVIFEKLVYKGLINKLNRRLVAGASLMVTSKLNDLKTTDTGALIEVSNKKYFEHVMFCELYRIFRVFFTGN